MATSWTGKRQCLSLGDVSTLQPSTMQTDMTPLPLEKERIRLFAVNSIIANHEMIIRHAQWDSQDVFDKQTNHTGHEQVVSDDEQGAHNLQPDLFAVPFNGASGIRQAECRATVDCCEYAG